MKWLNVLLALALTVLVGCSKQSSSEPKRSSGKIQVVTTTSMVSDLVRQVGGDKVEIQGLMGPGVDPHLYKAPGSDITKLESADVIFYSGWVLEGKMQDVFAKMARTKKHAYAVTEAVPQDRLMEPPEFSGHYDPHIWFDVPLWARCIDVVVKGLSEYAPQHQDYFEKQGKAAQAKMQALHQWAVKRALELPMEKRILVTSHDAFTYFGRAYGFRVAGLQGTSTVDEANTASMVKMVELIKKNNVKAVFVESSVPQHAIRRISQDAAVNIGGEVFSDAMGVPGKRENGYDLGSYEGMIKHNLNTIVEALK
jgi:manganese/zinc/iron transport system substrate-binding protein